MNSAAIKKASNHALRSRSFRRGALFLLVAVMLSSPLYILDSPSNGDAQPQKALLQQASKVVNEPSVEPDYEAPLEVASEPPKLETESQAATTVRTAPPRREGMLIQMTQHPDMEGVVAAPNKALTDSIENDNTAPIIENGGMEALPGGYIKISAAGERLPQSAEKWACVEDTATGLVWEVKSAERGLHHKGNLYSWYAPNESGRAAGVPDGGRCGGNIDCDSYAYALALNRNKYCGYADWRLPTLDEIVTIVEQDKESTGVWINRDYFPEGLRSWYWTATPNEQHPEYAWYLLFRNGIALSDRKDRSKHLRLVRTTGKAG